MNKPHQSINVGNPPARDQIIQILVGIIKSAEPDTNESTAKFIMDVQNTKKFELGPKINERTWKMAYFGAI